MSETTDQMTAPEPARHPEYTLLRTDDGLELREVRSVNPAHRGPTHYRAVWVDASGAQRQTPHGTDLAAVLKAARDARRRLDLSVRAARLRDELSEMAEHPGEGAFLNAEALAEAAEVLAGLLDRLTEAETAARRREEDRP